MPRSRWLWNHFLIRSFISPEETPHLDFEPNPSFDSSQITARPTESGTSSQRPTLHLDALTSREFSLAKALKPHRIRRSIGSVTVDIRPSLRDSRYA